MHAVVTFIATEHVAEKQLVLEDVEGIQFTPTGDYAIIGSNRPLAVLNRTQVRCIELQGEPSRIAIVEPMIDVKKAA